MIPDQSLVTTPEAVEFINNAKLETQRNVMLGDLKNFKSDPEMYNRVSASHSQLARAADTISKLANDNSRTEVEKHVAGKKVAEQTVAQLKVTRDSMLNLSEAYMNGVDAKLTETFKLPEGRSAIHSDIARWIKDEAKNGDNGYGNISKAVTTNSEFAKVLYQWPSELLGLPHEIRVDFINKAVKVWSPETRDAIDRYEMLRRTAAKYQGVIDRVGSSFYSKLKAAKIDKRVAI
jgi:hypothetical protein